MLLKREVRVDKAGNADIITQIWRNLIKPELLIKPSFSATTAGAKRRKERKEGYSFQRNESERMAGREELSY
jgi:hypothetical protein